MCFVECFFFGEEDDDMFVAFAVVDLIDDV